MPTTHADLINAEPPRICNCISGHDHVSRVNLNDKDAAAARRGRSKTGWYQLGSNCCNQA
jgi:hypothetical protein